jgi:hypothetical protein
MTGLAGLVEMMKSDAGVLRRNGAETTARLKEDAAAEIERAEPDALRWISEQEAMLRTGWSLEKVKKHAALYRHSGHAVKGPKGWRMLALVVPQLVPPSLLNKAAAREASR